MENYIPEIEKRADEYVSTITKNETYRQYLKNAYIEGSKSSNDRRLLNGILSELLNSYPKGEELYKYDAAFHISIDALLHGDNPVAIIAQLCEGRRETMDQLEKYVLRYGSLETHTK